MKEQKNVIEDESSQLWTCDLLDSIDNPQVAGDYILGINSANGDILLINVYTGDKLSWSIIGVSSITALCYGAGVIIAIHDEGTLSAVRLSSIVRNKNRTESVAPLWSLKSQLPKGSSNVQLVVKEESFALLYQLAKNGVAANYISSYYTADGKSAWSEANSPYKFTGNINGLCIGIDAFFFQNDGVLTAFNTDFGDQRFPKTIDAQALLRQDTPIHYANEVILGVGIPTETGQSIHSFKSDTSELKWSFPTAADNQEWLLGSVSDDLKQVLVYSTTGQLQLLNTTTGKEIWKNNLQLPDCSIIKNIQCIVTSSLVQIIIQGKPTVYSINLVQQPLTITPFNFKAGGDLAPLLANGTIIYSDTRGKLSAIPVLDDEQAAYFDGAENAILFSKVDPQLSFGTKNFSIECWIRSSYGGEVLYTEGDSINDPSLRFTILDEGKLSLAIINTEQDYDCVMSHGSNAIDGNWHHIAAIKKDNETQLFLDGVLLESYSIRAYNGNNYYNTNHQIKKNVDGSNGCYQLKVDDVRPPAMALLNQTKLAVASCPVKNSKESDYPFSGLLRELRIWNNALSVDKLKSRMLKVLGPLQTGDPKAKVKSAKEPMMLFNLHLDVNYNVYPNKKSSGITVDLRNDVVDHALWDGDFIHASSCPTDLELDMSAFPYLLDKETEHWPYMEHWAARGEHPISTNTALTNTGVLCFGANNALYGIRKNGGQRLWSKTTSEAFSNPLAVGPFIYFISEQNVFVIDSLSGDILTQTTEGDAKSIKTTTYNPNNYLAVNGDNIAYALEAGGIGLFKNGATIPLASTDLGVASNLVFDGNVLFWVSESTTGMFLVSYDLIQKKEVVRQAITSPFFCIDSECVYLHNTDIITVDYNNKIISKGTKCFNSVNGIAISEGNKFVIITDSEGNVTSLKVGALTEVWSKKIGGNVSSPQIEGRNVICTTSNGVLSAFDVSNGDLRATYLAANPIINEPLCYYGEVFFGCAESPNNTDTIDGALHQLTLGQSNVLALNGKSCVEISKTETSHSNFDRLTTAENCVEAWVNVKELSLAGILSVSSKTANIEFYIEQDGSLVYEIETATGGIQLKSNTALVPIQKWCHISVNLNLEGCSQLYIDGVAHTYTITKTPITTLGTSFTALFGANKEKKNLLNGLLGDVRIWDTYLSPAQLMERMHTKLLGSEANLVAAWNFDMLSIYDECREIIIPNNYKICLNSSSFVLDELNFDKPNYPFLTYQGLYVDEDQDKNGTPYKLYRLEISAHKADGSPLPDEELKFWYVKTKVEVGPSTVFFGKEENGSTPDSGAKLTAVANSSGESLNTLTNCASANTDLNGNAVLYVSTYDLKNGPGFDVYAPFLPENERFGVNVLVKSQELKKAPPPKVVVQSELIRDYKWSPGGKIDESRRCSIYRALVKAENSDSSYRPWELLTLYADVPTTVLIHGKSYTINKQNGVNFNADGKGELIVDSIAKDLEGYNLIIRAGFMHHNDSLKFAMAQSSHDRLAQVNSDDLTSSKSQYYTQKKVGDKISLVSKKSKLLSKDYDKSAAKVVTAFHHLTAVSNPQKKSVKSEELSNLTSTPMDQPIGVPKDDLVQPIRTLQYINRVKTMDTAALKESIKTAGAAQGTPDAVGVNIGMINGELKLEYLTSEDIQQREILDAQTLQKNQPFIIEGFFSGVFNKVEGWGNDMINGIKKATNFVIHLNNEVEAFISGELQKLGPIGCLLADAVEVVMGFVDVVLRFIEVTLILMIEFLTLLFEWEHIIHTHRYLRDDALIPYLDHASKALDGVSSKILKPLMAAPTQIGTSSFLNNSRQSLDRTKSKSANLGAVRGVKATSLIHKTNTHSAGITLPSSKEDMPITELDTENNIAIEIVERLSHINFNGSFSTIAEDIETLIKSVGESTLSKIFDENLDLLKTEASGAFGLAIDLLKQPIYIPFMSELYKFLTGDELSLLDLFALFYAVPVVVLYKIRNNGAFFDDGYNHQLIATMPTVGISNEFLKVEELNNNERMIVAFAVIEEIANISNFTADYILYTELKQPESVPPPLSGNMFRRIARGCSAVGYATSAALDYALNMNLKKDLCRNVDLAVANKEASKGEVDKQRGNIAYFDTLAILGLTLSEFFALVDFVSSLGPSLPVGSTGARSGKFVVGIGGVLYFKATVLNSLDLSGGVFLEGAQKESGTALQDRTLLFEAGNSSTALAFCSSMVKGWFSTRETATIFRTFSTFQFGFKTADVILKTVSARSEN